MNPALELTGELGAHVEAFLALEALAADSYGRFVFENDSQWLAFNRELLRQGAGEFSPPHGTLALRDGRPVGMLACLDADELRKARLLAAVCLLRQPNVTNTVKARARLAGTALYRVQADDYYLARIAVAPAEQRRGLGRDLLLVAEEQALSRGLKRLTLDVAEDAKSARRFHQGFGFAELGHGAAVDPETGRRLAYLHLGKVLSR
jgi:ribosomal protein S18 acetylase RimI-like enzyme